MAPKKGKRRGKAKDKKTSRTSVSDQSQPVPTNESSDLLQHTGDTTEDEVTSAPVDFQVDPPVDLSVDAAVDTAIDPPVDSPVSVHSSSLSPERPEYQKEAEAAAWAQMPMSTAHNMHANGLEHIQKSRLTESTLDPETNTLLDPESTEIVIEDILKAFPTMEAWRDRHLTAIARSKLYRKNVIDHILYHSCERNTAVQHIRARSYMLAQDIWPVNHFPAQVIQNQHEWVAWIDRLDEGIPFALKHLNWLRILEDEYEAIKPTWYRFWRLHDQNEALKKQSAFTYKIMPPKLLLQDLRNVLQELAPHNRRRSFLQQRILLCDPRVGQVLTRMPQLWYDWDRLINDILRQAQIPGPGVVHQTWEQEDNYAPVEVEELDEDIDENEDYDEEEEEEEDDEDDDSFEL